MEGIREVDLFKFMDFDLHSYSTKQNDGRVFKIEFFGGQINTTGKSMVLQEPILKSR